VLLTKDSETPEEIAEPSVVRDSIADLVLGYHLALLRPDPERVIGSFLAAQLREPQFRAHFVRVASGATRYGLTLDAVKGAEVWLPSLPEQRRIAEILTAVDDAIEATRAVIDQTRRLKTALLQDLLTHGLPGRHSEFREVHLGDVFTERKQHGLPGLPVMSVTMGNGLVPRDELDRRVESELAPEQHSLVCKGDIAYNMMRMWQGVFGLADYDCLVSPAYVVVTPKAGIRPQYAAYLFDHPHTIHQFHLFSQGVVDDRLRLYFDQFKAIPLRIVADEAEQEKIAAMLQSVDARIDAQTAELTTFQQMKSALSQALLTGEKRVCTNGEHE
jgi:type I restriction enzyme S subunit